jgi:hypothetical protein
LCLDSLQDREQARLSLSNSVQFAQLLNIDPNAALTVDELQVGDKLNTNDIQLMSDAELEVARLRLYKLLFRNNTNA